MTITGPELRFAPRIWILILLGYGLLSVAVTYPLVTQLGVALPGLPGDLPGYLWSFDLFWSSLLAGESPFFTTRVLFPLGVNMAQSASMPFLAVPAFFFLSDLILYADLLSLVAPVCAAAGMAALVRALTRHDAAAAFAGLLFGFSPIMMALMLHGRLAQLVAVAAMPFGILALVSFMRTAGLRPLLGLSAVTWWVAFTQVYPAASFLVMVAVIGLALMPSHLTTKHVGRIALAAVGNIALAWFVMTVVIPPMDTSDVARGGFGFTSGSVVNLADVLVPSAANPMLGSLHAYAWDQNDDVDSYFLGWGIVALALGGVVARRNAETVGLALGGVVALLLACGSVMRAGSFELLSHDWTPFEWLARLPFFVLLDAPRRLVVGVSLAVTALAGVGVAAIATRTGHWRLVLLGVLALAVVEYGHLGTPVSEIPIPEIYEQLAASPGDRTLLELGGGLAYSGGGLGLDWSTPSAFLMYWQTIHRKPRVGGYVSRVTHTAYDWFQDAPIMGDILTMAHAGRGAWSGTTYTPDEVTTFLRTFNLGYVIIPPYPPQPQYAEVIETLLAGRIAKTETDAEGFILYTLVDDPGAATLRDETPHI